MIRLLSDAELEGFPALDWPRAAAKASSEIANALEQVMASQDGSVLTHEQCLLLANAEGEDLLALLVAADRLRRDLVGNLVTYVVNRNINFTNMCFVGCKFCAFSRGPREDDSYFHQPRDDGAKSHRSMGTGRDRSLHSGRTTARSAAFLLSRHSPRREKLCPACISTLFLRWKLSTAWNSPACRSPDYLSMLHDNGLDTLPGTAAEILDDEIRHVLSRNKLSTAQWKEVIRTAHRCGIRSTSTLMYGHVETPAHWVNQLRFFAKFRARPAASPNSFRSASCIRTPCCFIKDSRAPGPRWPNISRFMRWRE